MPQRLVLSCVAWGESYVSDFLEFGLPTLMTSGNVPAVSRQRPVTLVIATSETDLCDLRAHPTIVSPPQGVTFEFRILKIREKHDRFHMTEGMLAALDIAIERRCLFSYSCADQIWPETGLSKLVAKLEHHRAVLSYAHRQTEDGLKEELRARKSGLTLGITAAEFGNLMLKYPHIEMQLCEVADYEVPKKPHVAVMYSPERDSAVVRSHALGLFGINFGLVTRESAIEYRRKLAGSTSDDSGTMRSIIGDLTNVYIPRSSEDFAVTSFQGPIDYAHRKSIPCKPEEKLKVLFESVARYQQNEFVDALARYFFTIPYLISPSANPKFCEDAVSETQELSTRSAIVLWSQSDASRRRPRRLKPLYMLSHWHPRRVTMGIVNRLIRRLGPRSKKPRD